VVEAKINKQQDPNNSILERKCQDLFVYGLKKVHRDEDSKLTEIQNQKRKKHKRSTDPLIDSFI
jgi:hypothetical protein